MNYVVYPYTTASRIRQLRRGFIGSWDVEIADRVITGCKTVQRCLGMAGTTRFCKAIASRFQVIEFK